MFDDRQPSARTLATTLVLVILMGACGDGMSPSLDGGAKPPDAPGLPDGRPRPRCEGSARVVCPADPAPCPGTCNAKGYCEVACDVGAEVRIPAESVVVGSDPTDPSRYIETETPEHLVRISRSFFIDKYEVTRAAWQRCVQDGQCVNTMRDLYCTYDGPIRVRPGWPSSMRPDDHPINCMKWDEAARFCAWKGGRLPTEAEWMLAARGAAGADCTTQADLQANDGRCNERTFPWGDEEDARRANVNVADGVDANSALYWRGQTTTPAGFFDGTTHDGYETHDGSSVYGVHDLVGNLLEWVGDYYARDYYSTSPGVDPKGPVAGTEREAVSVFWNATRETVPFRPLASRIGVDPASFAESVGFRCARDVP